MHETQERGENHIRKGDPEGVYTISYTCFKCLAEQEGITEVEATLYIQSTQKGFKNRQYANAAYNKANMELKAKLLGLSSRSLCDVSPSQLSDLMKPLASIPVRKAIVLN